MTKEEIISIIVALVSSGILNAFISSMLYSRKLKKELKSNGNNKIAETIENSLLEIRDLELKTTVQEILNVEEELKKRGSKVNIIAGEAIYPAIYNSMEELEKFWNDIIICRKKNEKNVPIKIALNLVFIDRYIMQSILFIKENADILNMQEWAALFIIDINKWQTKFDKMLVKEINKHNHKLESHEKRKWNKKRKKELEGQYYDTILNFLITGECNKKDKEIKNKIKNYIYEKDTNRKESIKI